MKMVNSYQIISFSFQVRMKEVFETEDSVYLVLELVTGSELFER